MALDRRQFITLVGTALVSWSSLVHAQTSGRVRTIAVLMGLADDDEAKERLAVFEQGLASKGWIIGQNLHIVDRYSAGDPKLMQKFATELVALHPDVIVAHSTPVVAALMRVTKTIPIVFVSVTDPVGGGFVQNIAHPGGNATGFTILQATITGKYLSILQEIAPHISRVAIIYNPQSAPGAGTLFLEPFIEVAKEFKIKPIVAQVHNKDEIRDAMSALASSADSGLIVMPDNFTTLHRQQFISLAAQLRIPTIYPYKYFAEEGGLLAYGVDAVDLFRRASDYVSRILNGAVPATLPVQAPTKFELIINLRTAKNLGIEMPRTLLAAADALIE
jgi:putative tryptophan/tyrosine transport system substrate-binding protein